MCDTQSRRRCLVGFILVASLGGMLLQGAEARVLPTPYRHAAIHLDDASSAWGIYIDPPTKTAQAAVAGVTRPSVDGKALQIALKGGQPYTGVHVYRNLMGAPQTAGARSFALSLRFRYDPSASPVQALEFTMSKWRNHRRWEWALQWERVGDGTAQQGQPPTWRLWNGTGWQNIGVRQDLAANRWHTLSLSGLISTGQRVRYVRFAADGRSSALSQTFSPQGSDYGDTYLAVGVQLDGNATESKYQVYLDHVSLQWG
jgi:hypothetical protein